MLFFFFCYRYLFTVSIFGLSLHLQHLSTNIILLQFLSSALGILISVIGHFVLNHMGRRITQLVLMSLRGIFMLTAVFVPQGKERVQGKKKKPKKPKPKPKPKRLCSSVFFRIYHPLHTIYLSTNQIISGCHAGN